MNVLIDTSIWSLALRRKTRDLSAEQGAIVERWGELIREKRAVLVGAIRQELLSGIRDSKVFERLCEHLRPFEDVPLTCEDYEEAARCFNTCRRAGVTGSDVDFLLCAVALRRRLEIFTTDGDFQRYSLHLPLRLHRFRLAGR